jgi:hypothetical protein
VGRTINEVFFHRARLGFLSDENVIMSAASDFWRFFPASVLQVLDDDPIDVGASHVKVSILKAAIPFDETLLLFSEQTQFKLGKTDILTPKTVSINQTTEFECNLRAKPVAAGSNVYFAQSRGPFSGMREYYVDSDTSVNDAADVTAHVPRYIPGNIFHLAASTNENVVVALTDAERDALYVYKFYWDRQQKLQSAWSKWKLPIGSTILSCEFIGSDLYLVIARDALYLEVMSLEAGRTDGSQDFVVHLDRRFNDALAESITYTTDEDGVGYTDILLPIWKSHLEPSQIVAWEGDASYKLGTVVPYETFLDEVQNRWIFRVKKHLTKFFIGTPYTFLYRFSTIFMREQTGQGTRALTEGRFQLRRMSLSYTKTGYFRAEVWPSESTVYRYPFSGRVLGSSENKLGEVPLETGEFRFPISASHDRVKIELMNDSYLPCVFQEAQVEGFYVLRSRRV